MAEKNKIGQRKKLSRKGVTPNFLRLKTPEGIIPSPQALSIGYVCFSKTNVRSSFLAQASPVNNPEGPPPIMITS